MSNKHERHTTAVNDSTGDLIKTKASNQQAYADNWERIFGKKEKSPPRSYRPEDVTVVLVPEDGKEIMIHAWTDDMELTLVSGDEENGVDTSFKEELLPEGVIGDEE